MTTRRKRQAQRMKAYGLVLKTHRCGRAIFVGDDNLFFPAQERSGMDPVPGKEPIAACPQCGREILAKDLAPLKADGPDKPNEG